MYFSKHEVLLTGLKQNAFPLLWYKDAVLWIERLHPIGNGGRSGLESFASLKKSLRLVWDGLLSS